MVLSNNSVFWVRQAAQSCDLPTHSLAGELPDGVREDEPELERVEQLLHEHDEANVRQLPLAGSRRSGGLVGSVRGLMSRRGRKS